MGFRISCKSDPNLFVSIRDGQVVLAPVCSCDETQQWVKETFSSKVVDIEGVSCYALINEATNHAIRCSNQDQAVTLVPYVKGVVNLSLMWSEALDSDHVGYNSIRMGGNIKLYFDAKNAKVAVNGGADIILCTRNRKNNQWWKMEEHKPPLPELKGPTYRLKCKANESLSLTIRDGKLVLANNDPNDDRQKWYKDGRHGSKVKDMYDFPGYSLINKATREAIKLIDAEKGTVKPTPYNPDDPDQTFLWGGGDGTGGFSISIKNVIAREVDHPEKERVFSILGGTARDGAELITTKWFGVTTQHWVWAESN